MTRDGDFQTVSHKGGTERVVPEAEGELGFRREAWDQAVGEETVSLGQSRKAS